MKTRKLVLIIADLVLLTVCIIQCAISAHDTTKYFELKDSPDTILIDTPEEKGITVVKDGDKWFVGNDKFPANEAIVDDFVTAMTSIRVLDKVGTTNEANLDRYELNETKHTVVKALKDGKVVRQIAIGKEASSNSQSYITVDEGKDIYLATGNLNYIFDTITSAIRSEIVMNLESSTITEVSITKADGNTWSLSRMGNGDDIAWNVSGAEIEVDNLKATSWFSTLASLTTRNWYEEKDVPAGGEKILTAKITHAFQTSTIDIYAIPKVEGVPQAYYAFCSDMPYKFAMDSNVYDTYNKNPEDLAK